MEALTNDFAALSLLAFVLGARHGFDADHLATIDGLTRFNASACPRLARLCGVLFSLGHGAVVVLIAVAVGALAQRWQAPEWLESFGAGVSIAFLFGIGFANIHAVLRAAPGEVVRPVGFKGHFLGRLAQAGNPFWIALVGALFALSFDTVSQAALFALMATQFGGWHDALLLGLLFMLGMLVTDGLNGLWISRLIRRTDEAAAAASRIMSLAVAGISLAVGGFGLVKIFSPAIDAWSDGKELLIGAGVVAAIAASFAIAVRLARAAGPHFAATQSPPE